ncbi:collagen alpha-1(I) chain-like [Pithys albifrons albifrons]|uniref:collagen alpha-1(I) chain-like n=1 Tax=Pithys albifrons albifrons TaxID=3385563 RepID=UPI003A5CFA3B
MSSPLQRPSSPELQFGCYYRAAHAGPPPRGRPLAEGRTRRPRPQRLRRPLPPPAPPPLPGAEAAAATPRSPAGPGPRRGPVTCALPAVPPPRPLLRPRAPRGGRDRCAGRTLCASPRCVGVRVRGGGGGGAARPRPACRETEFAQGACAGRGAPRRALGDVVLAGAAIGQPIVRPGAPAEGSVLSWRSLGQRQGVGPAPASLAPSSGCWPRYRVSAPIAALGRAHPASPRSSGLSRLFFVQRTALCCGAARGYLQAHGGLCGERTLQGARWGRNMSRRSPGAECRCRQPSQAPGGAHTHLPLCPGVPNSGHRGLAAAPQALPGSQENSSHTPTLPPVLAELIHSPFPPSHSPRSSAHACDGWTPEAVGAVQGRLGQRPPRPLSLNGHGTCDKEHLAVRGLPLPVTLPSARGRAPHPAASPGPGPASRCQPGAGPRIPLPARGRAPHPAASPGPGPASRCQPGAGPRIPLPARGRAPHPAASPGPGPASRCQPGAGPRIPLPARGRAPHPAASPGPGPASRCQPGAGPRIPLPARGRAPHPAASPGCAGTARAGGNLSAPCGTFAAEAPVAARGTSRALRRGAAPSGGGARGAAEEAAEEAVARPQLGGGRSSRGRRGRRAAAPTGRPGESAGLRGHRHNGRRPGRGAPGEADPPRRAVRERRGAPARAGVGAGRGAAGAGRSNAEGEHHRADRGAGPGAGQELPGWARRGAALARHPEPSTRPAEPRGLARLWRWGPGAVPARRAVPGSGSRPVLAAVPGPAVPAHGACHAVPWLGSADPWDCSTDMQSHNLVSV